MSKQIYFNSIYLLVKLRCCKITNLDLSYEVMVKFSVEISQNFVAFSEYMNLTFSISKLQVHEQSCPETPKFLNCHLNTLILRFQKIGFLTMIVSVEFSRQPCRLAVLSKGSTQENSDLPTRYFLAIHWLQGISWCPQLGVIQVGVANEDLR